MDNFHNISKFIKENDLELFTDVSDDLICIICKRIMTNATSAPCRCRYCYECIKQYLNGKSKLFCPGSAKYCKIDFIDFQRDIHVDNIINSRISKLIVKCPQKTCEFKSELNLIKDHIEICDKRLVDCPYLQLGCSKEDVQLNNMTPHLYEDSFIHNKLLIEYINNFKNDVEILKNDMKTMADENVRLNEQIIINNLNAEKKELKLNEIIETIQNENKTMKEEINNLLSENETWRSTQDNEELKVSIENIEEKQKSLEEDAANGHKNISELSENSVKLSSSIVCFNETLDSLKERIQIMENQLITYKNEEFVWKIDNISERVKTTIELSDKIFYSEPFYTHKNGYKMCLYVIPQTFLNRISVFFSIMKGPFDDILPWPCKLDVSTGLVCQLTGISILNKTKKYINNASYDVYKKPNYERNKGCLALKYLEWNKLLATEKLVKNNQLFIKCAVRVFL